MWYGEKCIGCDRSREHRFTIELAPNQKIEGSCLDKTKALYIVEKMLSTNSTALTKFELTEVKTIKKQ